MRRSREGWGKRECDGRCGREGWGKFRGIVEEGKNIVDGGEKVGGNIGGKRKRY